VAQLETELARDDGGAKRVMSASPQQPCQLEVSEKHRPHDKVKEGGHERLPADAAAHPSAENARVSTQRPASGAAAGRWEHLDGVSSSLMG
jgi:hypothetical protein